MSNVLYITANPKAEEESYSLSVGRAFITAYKESNPDDRVIELDLYRTELPSLDHDIFSGWGKLQQGVAFSELSEPEQSKITSMNAIADQFVAADKYVFATPMWNFSLPPAAKAYIDAVCVAGKTFRYTENGPVGLLHGKRAVHIQARGGIYSEGPIMDREFGDRYLRTVLAFLGVHDVQSIYVEGMGQMPEESERIRAHAIGLARLQASTF